ncbi:hypothetical protein DCAR_0312227 [Daucus carota subsp. sativus]|uniref:NAD(P)H-quinone oxidoreductase subunit 5, chloroplastic n=1 Tax=Daucus carota subsp. sativus TaxID=79200 RepID=A0AAF0WPF7_DAUCS|nr:hypothetical protein DCAR_0312227 [Daucus carota subsp. sativus]
MLITSGRKCADVSQKREASTYLHVQLIGIYDWSYNRGYIDAFYARFFIWGIRGLAKVNFFF